MAISEYELSTIIGNYDHDMGGVDNTNVPNFVYRWTEREVYKLISCYEPQFKHKINFFMIQTLGVTKM